jgi:hypothetical protein
MKIWKNLAPLVVGISIVLAYSNCATERASFVEQVSDGYVFTADAESLKKIRDHSNYAITFVVLGEQKADRQSIKKALSDPSRHSTVQGKATKVGGNKLKITTTSTLTVDLKRPFATFWGVNAERLRELVSSGHAAGTNCPGCGGIPDMKQVTCHDPASTLCCNTCP